MSKALVVYAHPNPASYNHAVKEKVQSVLESEGYQVSVRDLYQLKFDPILTGEDFQGIKTGNPKADVKAEQAFIKEAGLLVFVFPIWWFNMPAVLKGYIDRVLSYGFGYTFDAATHEPKGLLNGKKVIILNTTGGPQEAYEKNGLKDALAKTIDAGNFEFCGLKVIWHKYFYAVPGKPREELSALLEQAADEFRKALKR